MGYVRGGVHYHSPCCLQISSLLGAGAFFLIAYHNNRDVVKVGGKAFVCRHSAAMPGIEG